MPVMKLVLLDDEYNFGMPLYRKNIICIENLDIFFLNNLNKHKNIFSICIKKITFCSSFLILY